jgi:hypothetical protein
VFGNLAEDRKRGEDKSLKKKGEGDTRGKVETQRLRALGRGE